MGHKNKLRMLMATSLLTFPKHYTMEQIMNK
jgi:hypothetical protein